MPIQCDELEYLQETFFRIKADEIMEMVCEGSPGATIVALQRLRIGYLKLVDDRENGDEFIDLYQEMFRQEGAYEKLRDGLSELGLRFFRGQKVRHRRYGDGRVLDNQNNGEVIVRFQESKEKFSVMWPFQLSTVV